MSHAFVTKKIAAGYMIERKNPRAWLTLEGTWDKSIFEGAAFKTRQDAERVLADVEKTFQLFNKRRKQGDSHEQ